MRSSIYSFLHVFGRIRYKRLFQQPLPDDASGRHWRRVRLAFPHWSKFHPLITLARFHIFACRTPAQAVNHSRNHVQRDWTCLARAAAATEVRPAPCIIGLRLRWSSVVFTSVAVSQFTKNCSSSTSSFGSSVTHWLTHRVGATLLTVGVDRWTLRLSSAPGSTLRGLAPRYGPYCPTAVLSTPDPLRTPSEVPSTGRAQPRGTSYSR